MNLIDVAEDAVANPVDLIEHDLKTDTLRVTDRR